MDNILYRNPNHNAEPKSNAKKMIKIKIPTLKQHHAQKHNFFK